MPKITELVFEEARHPLWMVCAITPKVHIYKPRSTTKPGMVDEWAAKNEYAILRYKYPQPAPECSVDTDGEWYRLSPIAAQAVLNHLTSNPEGNDNG